MGLFLSPDKRECLLIPSQLRLEGNMSLLRCALVVAVAAFAVLLSSNTLDGEFLFDDRRSIVSNPVAIRRLPLKAIWTSDYWGMSIKSKTSHKSYRPLTTLSFRLNHAWNGMDPWGWHLVNILAHGLVASLVMIVALRLFDDSFLPALLAGEIYITSQQYLMTFCACRTSFCVSSCPC